MKARIEKDKKYRKNFQKKENTQIFYKAVMHDKRIKKEIKFIFKQSHKYNQRLNSHTLIRNRCLLTGNAHSVIKFFRLTQTQILRLGFSGYLIGITGSSW